MHAWLYIRPHNARLLQHRRDLLKLALIRTFSAARLFLRRCLRTSQTRRRLRKASVQQRILADFKRPKKASLPRPPAPPPVEYQTSHCKMQRGDLIPMLQAHFLQTNNLRNRMQISRILINGLAFLFLKTCILKQRNYPCVRIFYCVIIVKATVYL